MYKLDQWVIYTGRQSGPVIAKIIRIPTPTMIAQFRSYDIEGANGFIATVPLDKTHLLQKATKIDLMLYG